MKLFIQSMNLVLEIIKKNVAHINIILIEIFFSRIYTTDSKNVPGWLRAVFLIRTIYLIIFLILILIILLKIIFFISYISNSLVYKQISALSQILEVNIFYKLTESGIFLLDTKHRFIKISTIE